MNKVNFTELKVSNRNDRAEECIKCTQTFNRRAQNRIDQAEKDHKT